MGSLFRIRVLRICDRASLAGRPGNIGALLCERRALHERRSTARRPPRDAPFCRLDEVYDERQHRRHVCAGKDDIIYAASGRARELYLETEASAAMQRPSLRRVSCTKKRPIPLSSKLYRVLKTRFLRKQ